MLKKSARFAPAAKDAPAPDKSQWSTSNYSIDTPAQLTGTASAASPIGRALIDIGRTTLLGALGGLALGAVGSVVQGGDLFAALGAAGLAGGIIGLLGAGFGSADTRVYTGLAALLGAALGALGGPALGADAWLMQNIAAIENANIARFISNYVAIVGGPNTAVGAIGGILLGAAIDTFRGGAALKNGLLAASGLAVLGAIVAAIGGADFGAGAALGAIVGALLGAFLLASDNLPANAAEADAAGYIDRA